jgi:ABC-type branched-subunit amino acid transport system ATPase component
MSLLELEGVTVAFGGVVAVDGVDAALEEGRVTSLIGPNGAGKTTLMNVVSGVTSPQRGKIRFRGRDVSRWSTHRVARLGMARTFQNLELFADMTVRENVLVGCHARMRAGILSSAIRMPRHLSDERAFRRVADDMLERLELTDVAQEEATALPYGIQRRVEVARALAADPVLLLLDEPMAGLSREEAAEAGRKIRELVADGLTVLLIEHAMEAVMAVSDHILVLHRGSLLAEGTPSEIQANPEVIAAYLGDEDL